MKKVFLSFLLFGIFLAGCSQNNDINDIIVEILTVDEAGNFVDGATISVYDTANNLVSQVKTLNGFVNVNLKEGTYKFEAKKDNLVGSVTKYVSQDDPLVKITLIDEQTSKLQASVKVVSIDGLDVVGAKVEALGDNYSEVTYTNKDGFATLDLPRPDGYIIKATFGENSDQIKVYIDEKNDKVAIPLFIKECYTSYPLPDSIVYSCLKFKGYTKIKDKNSAMFVSAIAPTSTVYYYAPGDEIPYFAVIVGIDGAGPKAGSNFLFGNPEEYSLIVNNEAIVSGAGLTGAHLTLIDKRADYKRISETLIRRDQLVSNFINGSKLVQVDEVLQGIAGAGPYDGKKLALKFTEPKVEENIYYNIGVSLLDPSNSKNNLIQSVEVSGGMDGVTDLKSVFIDSKSKKSLIKDNIYVDYVFKYYVNDPPMAILHSIVNPSNKPSMDSPGKGTPAPSPSPEPPYRR